MVAMLFHLLAFQMIINNDDKNTWFENHSSFHHTLGQMFVFRNRWVGRYTNQQAFTKNVSALDTLVYSPILKTQR